MVAMSLPIFRNTAIAVTPEVTDILNAKSPVAIGVSGGKDSSAVALATIDYLNQIGHTGPRILIHSHLGRVEWKDSLPACERLADRLSVELVVVRRAAGGMMERWQVRWRNNVARYANLECVKLILPWSTPAMRFCTSELKTAIICRELTRRFPRESILSVSGIRRDESTSRAKAPVVKEQPKLTSKTHNTWGMDWHPIIDWSLSDTLAYLEEKNFPLHEAYTKFGSSRVSCAFCIMGSKSDLKASSSCPDNANIYREMVALEVESSFGFQDSAWLGDVAPNLLDEATRAAIPIAKFRASVRQTAESRIPKHLLYTKGWPTVMPTHDEASLLAEVRQQVSEAMGLAVEYRDADSVRGRYAELMAAKESQN